MYQFYLLAQAEQGSAEAFWVLTEQFLPVIFNKVWLLSGSSEETKEIISQGLPLAWAKVGELVKPGAFVYFLSRAIVETALTYLKKRKSPVSFSFYDEEVQKDASPLIEAVFKLNWPERWLIVLRYLENLTLQEIAKLLKLKEEQVSEALAGVLSSLRTRN